MKENGLAKIETGIQLKDLIQRATLNGLSPVLDKEYSPAEKQQIKNELFMYATAKQETISPIVFETWLQTFQDMRLEYSEAVKRIRVAKMSKRYGTGTEFGDFMGKSIDEVNKEYFDYYKHEKPKYILLHCNKCRTTKKILEGELTDMKHDCGGTFETH